MDISEVVALTQTLVKSRSVSRDGNAAVSNIISEWLNDHGFEVEILEYDDKQGVRQVNVIGKLGQGEGGMAFCSHSDTVPGQEDQWPAFDPQVRDGRLYGRGSCDMKGPLAATMIAAAAVDPNTLTKPLYIVVTADEEVGLLGAKIVSTQSKILRESRPEYGIIAEPTRLIPVYGHKGFGKIVATALGEAAHTSTGLGRSANFLIAPFLADMADLAHLLQSDPSFANPAFSPPTNGFNMVIDDGHTPPNVTASKSVATLTFRAMPDARAAEVIEIIEAKAQNYGLTCEVEFDEPLVTDANSDLVRVACDLTGYDQPELVPYGTDGVHLQNSIDKLIILGPGDIAVAHTVGESIPIAQLEQSVDIYRNLIEHLCTT